MTTVKNISDAYLFLRANNHTIPDDAIEFIRLAALEKLELIDRKQERRQVDNDVKKLTECQEALIAFANSMIEPSQLTDEMIELARLGRELIINRRTKRLIAACEELKTDLIMRGVKGADQCVVVDVSRWRWDEFKEALADSSKTI